MKLVLDASALSTELKRLGSFVGSIKRIERLVISVKDNDVHIAAEVEELGKSAVLTLADSEIVEAPKDDEPGVVLNGYSLSTITRGVTKLKLSTVDNGVQITSVGGKKRVNTKLPTFDWADIRIARPKNTQPLKVADAQYKKMGSILTLINLPNTRKENSSVHMMFRGNAKQGEFVLTDGNHSAYYNSKSLTFSSDVSFEIEKGTMDMIHQTANGSNYSLYVGENAVAAIGSGMKLYARTIQAEMPYSEERVTNMNKLISRINKSKAGFTINKRELHESLDTLDGVDDGETDLIINKNTKRQSCVDFTMASNLGSMTVTHKVDEFELPERYPTGRTPLMNILNAYPENEVSIKFGNEALLVQAAIADEGGKNKDRLVYMNAIFQDDEDDET